MRANLIAAILVLLPATAGAAGFSVNEQGAAGTARCSSIVAGVDDPSAIFWNPAALTGLAGAQIYLGGTLILPHAHYTPADPALNAAVTSDTGPALVPNAYASYRIGKSLAAGLGISAPFGLAISWPATSPGRGLIREQSLTTIFISPTIAARVPGVPGLSVAASLDVVPASVKLTRDVVFGSSIGSAVVGGSAFGLGGHAGVLYVAPKLPLRVGVTYKAPVKLAFEGDADFDADPIYRADLPPDGAMSAEITLPQSLLTGVSYKPLENLEVEADVHWVNWSSYDKLEVVLPGGATSTAIKNYEATLTYRIAAELTLGRALSLRAGYSYDPTPIPATTLDFTLPDINRNVVAVGASYHHKKLTVNVAASWVLPGERQTAVGDNAPVYKGTYGLDAPIFALDLGYKL